MDKKLSRRILTGVLALSIVLNVTQGVVGVKLYSKAKSTSDEVAATSDTSTDNSTTEDNVTIDGQYVILSTKTISDAYISGDTSGLSTEEKETLEMASDILKEIITDNMTDYDKEKAVYDWMCSNLTTDEGVMTVITTTAEGVDNPHGVLKNRKAICVGYATTFRLFMQIMGIDCMVIHDTELVHSWNLVKLDGNWYHTDIYSDVGSGNYATFNLSDEMMQEIDEDAESWDTDFFPAADSIEYNYLYQNAETDTDIYNIASKVRAALDSGETAVALKYETTLSDEEKQAVSKMINSISIKLMSKLTDTTSETYLSSSTADIDNGTFVLVNIVTYEWDDSEEYGEKESTLSEETQTKITEAVDSAFSDYSA